MVLRNFKAKLDNISTLTPDTHCIEVPYIPGVQPSEWPENQSEQEAEDDDEIDFRTSMGLDLDTFITFFTIFKVYPDYMAFYPHLMNRIFDYLSNASDHFRERLNSRPFSITPSEAFNTQYERTCETYKDSIIIYRRHKDILNKKLYDTLQFSIILEYKLINDNDTILTRCKIVIFSLYLLSPII